MLDSIANAFALYHVKCPKCGHVYDLKAINGLNKRMIAVQCFCKTNFDLKPHLIFRWTRPRLTVRQ